jgi:hypothetical protein
LIALSAISEQEAHAALDPGVLTASLDATSFAKIERRRSRAPRHTRCRS